MKTRFRRAISKTQRCSGEAFRSNPFGREILPTDEKLRAACFRLRNRFQVWITRSKPRFVMRLIQNAVDRWPMGEPTPKPPP